MTNNLYESSRVFTSFGGKHRASEVSSNIFNSRVSAGTTSRNLHRFGNAAQ